MREKYAVTSSWFKIMLRMWTNCWGAMSVIRSVAPRKFYFIWQMTDVTNPWMESQIFFVLRIPVNFLNKSKCIRKFRQFNWSITTVKLNNGWHKKLSRHSKKTRFFFSRWSEKVILSTLLHFALSTFYSLYFLYIYLYFKS